MQPQFMPQGKQQPTGADAPINPTAHEAQRAGQQTRTGEYLCEACRSRFMYTAGYPLACPNCKNKVADSLVPVYMEEDPASEEMLTRDEFSAGD